MDYALFGHLTYILIALSFLVRDILWLRLVAVVASVSSMVFNYVVPAQPLWLVINWNLVFVAINLTRIVLLLKERMGIDLSPEEAELHREVFGEIGIVEFARLMRAGLWREAASGSVLATEGEPVEKLVLIYAGQAEVRVGGRRVALLGGGDFIGEMSFTTQAAASATVVCTEGTRLVEWPKEGLGRLLQRHPGLRNGFQAALGRNMAAKLVGKGERSPEGPL